VRCGIGAAPTGVEDAGVVMVAAAQVKTTLMPNRWAATTRSILKQLLLSASDNLACRCPAKSCLAAPIRSPVGERVAQKTSL
jgi:hypothetical protein